MIVGVPHASFKAEPVDDGFDQGLTNRLASIAARMNTDDPARFAPAIADLRQMIDTLPAWVLTADEALTLQALALSIAEVIETHADDEEMVFRLMGYLAKVLRASGSFSEMLTGSSIEERSFFARGRAPRLQ